MNDYAIKKNIEQNQDEELAIKLENLLKRFKEEANSDGRYAPLYMDVDMILKDIKDDWPNNTILIPMLEQIAEIANFKIITYNLGRVFSGLNASGYSLIRNGLITLGGESNSGKTSVMTSLSLDILENNPKTAFICFSLDDSYLMTGKRIISQMTKQNKFNEIFNTNELNIKQREILSRIIILERINLATLEEQVKKVKEVTDSEEIIIGIDYLQIIPNDTQDLQRDFLNKAVKELKEIQKRLDKVGGCIIFLLSQFNRDTKSTTYRYRETSEIENQSDVCIDIFGKMKKTKHQDTGDPMTVPDLESPIRRIKVTKNKLGMKGRTWETNIGQDFNFTLLNVSFGDDKIENPSKDYQPSDNISDFDPMDMF